MSSCIIGAGNLYGRFKKVTTRRVWGCTDLSFNDQHLAAEIPLSAAGTPGLITAAQEIIPAINEVAGAAIHPPASGVDIEVIGSPTYTNVQDAINQIGSAGSDGEIYITKLTGTSYDVAAGAGFIRIADSNNALLKAFDWIASLAITIPVGTARYVGIDYNGGAPIVVVKTVDSWNGHTEFRLGSVVEQNGLHITNSPQRMADGVADIWHRFFETRPYERANRLGGIINGETGTRNITVTAGELYDGLNEFHISALDTSGVDTFDYYYGDGGVGWTAQLAQTQWNNTQYDDGSGLLATMTNNWFASIWLYIEADGGLVLLFGQGQFATLQGAEQESPPSTVPLRVQVGGRLIGRFIFQKSAATTSKIETVWDEDYNPTVVTDHGALSNVTANQHHAQTHGTADHSGIIGAHSQISAVGVNDHHAQVHGAADHSGAIGAHSQITSVTANQHHNENHQARHNQGGADPLKLDDLATPDDNTDLNASTSRHGLLLKLGGGTTNFLRADGTWQSPGGGSTLFGTQHQYAESEGASSTNLTAYQTKVTMTTPSLPSGDYIVQYQCEIADQNADPMNMQARLDGTEIGHSHFPDDIYTDLYMMTSGYKVVNIAGVHVLDIRYRAYTVTYTAYIRRARVRIYRIN